MSSDSSAKSSNNSTSESSSSPNQTHSLHDSKSITDLTLFGSPAPTLSRTGTVKKAGSTPSRKDKGSNSSNEDGEALPPQIPKAISPEPAPAPIKERLRKSLDSTYRHSLESISEYKTRHSFSTATSFTSRTTGSIESSSTDSTDNAIRSGPELSKEETKMSPSSSYLSWIESVNSEYFGSAVSSGQEAQDVDNKVGEWNNFWLNYNSARGKYVSSSYQAFGCSTKAADDTSDAKSNCSGRSGRSGQKDFADGLRGNALLLGGVTLTADEVQEAIRCSQKIADILGCALRRAELDAESVNNDSYYSETSRHNSYAPDVGYGRERSVSCVVDPQQVLQKQKQLLQTQPQSSSTSCINAILSTGVTDMLRRVISKSRRDVSAMDEARPLTRSSFSEWSTK